MTAKQARDNFTDLLGAVYYGKKPIAVEKKGRIFAVVVNPDDYQAMKNSAKTRFFDTVDTIQKSNKNTKSQEVDQDIASAVENIRQEKYAQNG